MPPETEDPTHSKSSTSATTGLCSRQEGSPCSISSEAFRATPTPSTERTQNTRSGSTAMELEGLLSPVASSHIIGNHRSPAGSSTTSILCRICHGDAGEGELTSLCHCAGSMGLVHTSCLERWLEYSNTTHCEICNYAFNTQRKPKSFVKWFCGSTSVDDRRNLLADLACFMVLTPVAIVSMWLCMTGASHYSDQKASEWEVAGLMSLAGVLMAIHMGWCVLAFRYHLRIFRRWRTQNQEVKLVDNSNMQQPRQYNTRDQEELGNMSPHCTHSGPCDGHYSGGLPCQHVRRRGFSESSVQSGSFLFQQQPCAGSQQSAVGCRYSCRQRGISESSATTCHSCKQLLNRPLSDGSLCSTCKLPYIGAPQMGMHMAPLPRGNRCCRRNTSPICRGRPVPSVSMTGSSPAKSCSCTMVTFSSQLDVENPAYDQSDDESQGRLGEAIV